MLTADLIPIGHPGAGSVATGYAILGVCIYCKDIIVTESVKKKLQGARVNDLPWLYSVIV
jgi:hypothetical protein